MTEAIAPPEPSTAASATPRTLASIAAGGFGFVVLFQLTIVLGAPVGPAAWGGGHSGQLPPNLRLASVFSALFWSAAAMTVLSRGGIARPAIPPRAAGIGTWALVVILAVGTLTNIASRSNWERYGWAPLSWLSPSSASSSPAHLRQARPHLVSHLDARLTCA